MCIWFSTCVCKVFKAFCLHIYTFVTLEHKTSLKSLGYIYSKSQKYIVWVKIIDFSFMAKIIRILIKIFNEDEDIY